ncbi:hypothetical protein C8Q74DRAFT_1242919 [Fomes fomentarius]|nr:hypothetical protein C8Q74DRAFT_1242919 [Fomes fomentarius]
MSLSSCQPQDVEYSMLNYTSEVIQFLVPALLSTVLFVFIRIGWRLYICGYSFEEWASQDIYLSCMQTASLTINIIVGDAIVWWRALVLCQWTGRSRYAILSVCFMVLSSTFAISIADTCNACSLQYLLSFDRQSDPGTGQLFAGTKRGAAASVLTLLSNIITVALTSYKACTHVRFRNMVASQERRATQVHKTLALLIESGLIYCAIWLLVSIYQVGMNVPALYFDDTVDFWMVMGYFVGGALVPIIAIYPMAIIVMVALKTSSGTTVSVSMPASSALTAQRRGTHGERLRNGTSYPIMMFARGQGPSNSGLAEEESIEDNSAAKREVIEMA